MAGNRGTPNKWSFDHKRPGANHASLRAIRSKWEIYFPSIPEQIELSRSSNFDMNLNPAMPDGFPVFRGTNAMEIPIAFKLHAYDDSYCDHGPMTLIDIAAKLHSAVLPDGAKTDVTMVNSQGEQVRRGTAEADMISGKLTEFDDFGVATGKAATIKTNLLWPEPVSLNLIGTGSPYNPGVNFSGFIKSVSVTLRGPWLNTPDSSYYNLPSSAEYKFTMVHSPGYLGVISDNRMISMYQTEVSKKLFNIQLSVAKDQQNFNLPVR
jgi:hypothetical protein